MSGAHPSPAAPVPLLPGGVSGTLLLIRHAQSTWVAQGRFQGRLDPPLSPLGEEQAHRVAAWLAGPAGAAGLDLAGAPCEIAHSPLTRVAQTASRIADAFADTALLRPEAGLVEIGVGDWSGLTVEEVDARWPAEHAAWRRDPIGTTPPGGETLGEADARVRAAVPGLLASLAAARAPDRGDGDQPWSIVVAHGGILRLLLFALLDLPLDRFWAFPFALASVSVVTVGGGRASLAAHNLAEHLAGLDGAAGGLRAF